MARDDVSSSISSGASPAATIWRIACDDLLPATVVEGEGEDEPVVVLGQVDGIEDRLPEVGGEAVEAADVAELRALAVQLLGLALDHLAEDAHDALRSRRRGRRQFSVEKAQRVRYSMPSSPAA